MRRLASIPGLTFLLFLFWKAGLLLFTAQPIPANDSFFYDGPVVNYLLHGKYCNPSLAEVLPISGAEVFSAYPPLHQFALWLWMSAAGTSALAAMWYHVALLGVYALAVFGTLRELKAAPAAINWAGLFLFGITFHDRPDTLAQALGALAIWALVISWNRQQPLRAWLAAGLLLLTFCTSLQIGGIYMLWIGLLVFSHALWQRSRIPWAPVLCFLSALVGLIALVRFGFPHLWAGFREHVTVTPSLTGWRMPTVGELLKIGRATAGIFLTTACLGFGFATGRWRLGTLRESPAALVVIAGVVTAMGLVTGCLTMLSPNTIHIANYLQPMIVGSFLAVQASARPDGKSSRPLGLAFGVMLALVSIRAVGLSTWGVWCARDFGYRSTMEMLGTEVRPLRGDQPVAASAAYLYEVARIAPVRWIHSDWIGNRGGGQVDLEPESLVNLRPQKLILTQFDYYRRYQPLLERLQGNAALAQIQIRDLAKVPPPDAKPALQKVLQHLAWAPVIVDITWKPKDNENANH